MRHARHITLMLSILMLVALAAGPWTVQAQDRRVQVVASFSILADVARQVAGDAADVTSLMGVGVNPHTFEPSARDVVALTEADAVLVVGLNFEEGLLPVLSEAAGDRVVPVSDCVPVRPVTDGSGGGEQADRDSLAVDPQSPCADHHATVAAAFGLDQIATAGSLGLGGAVACGDDHAGDHAAGSCDPHVWTDPVNAGLWTLAIRDTLSALDPANAATYAANADAYLVELATLAADVQALVDSVPPEHRFLVTNHLAFNYFADRFGLTLVGVVIPGGSTTSEPSVRDVLALIETIQDYHVPAIFTEETVSEDLARQVAGETGAALVPLYTGSLSESGGPADTYLAYLRFNAVQIADALGGGG